MSEQLLDFVESDEQAGFRLQYFEMYNWGTFDRRVWSLEATGDNVLLTGDIGSGKSTLADALSTLLVPPQKLAYNKAAGAENRERNLRSYVFGHYKTERSESGPASRAVALRDQNQYSVLLANFHNVGFGTSLTLAQVYWNREAGAPPQKLYICSARPLHVNPDFAGFGSDVAELKKRLRQQDGVELFDSYTAYAASFRRVFGIANEQALDLFNQTVSMKSVGNLTDFVREHMIESFDASARIQALIDHFEDLNRAHETVLRAKAQIAALKPLRDDCRNWLVVDAERATLRQRREALSPWFIQRKSELLEKRLAILAQDAARLESHISAAHDQLRTLQADRDGLRQAINDNGGDRLERIAAELEQLRAEKNRRQERSRRYKELAGSLDLPVPDAAGADAPDVFISNQTAVAVRQQQLADGEAEIQNERVELETAFRSLRRQHDELAQELASLRSRQSNIPARQIGIRQRLCSDLKLPPASLPFVGELLQVRTGEQQWTGVIERVLHNFALSLLVSDEDYARVCAWVDSHDLGDRLVYFRVRNTAFEADQKLHPQSLVRKLDIKDETRWVTWLEHELARRFDYACADTLEQFQRERQAVRPGGQVKTAGDRHEKDDRHRLDDASRWVLGWTNADKIALLAREQKRLEAQLADSAAGIGTCQQKLKTLQEAREHCAALLSYTDWKDQNWREPALRIADLETERKQLEAASNQLKLLQQQLKKVEQALEAADNSLAELRSKLAVNRHRHNEAQTLRASLEERLSEWKLAELESCFAALQAMASAQELLRTLTVESCESKEQELRRQLQAQIDGEDRKATILSGRIIKAMDDFRHSWPVETRELDAAVEASPHWIKLLEQLEADDLPRFETSFKAALNENAIREVLNFNMQLKREQEEIRERIERINESLVRIDYNPGRYIVLEAEPSPDPELREFIASLRSCTEGFTTGSEDEQYAEAKFLQVRALIERFKGREGLSDLDRRWTRKVSDVRQYFVFSASERWKEDHSEYEHYRDSAGKSGGQKEKLAYTVLAASLAYQFGLDWSGQRSRSFRFVMIDEAFGRGSDESARFALDLFRQLRLQILIITPLQKIHIIEPFVRTVGFVANPDGARSSLRVLSIEEYRSEREQYRSEQAAGQPAGETGTPAQETGK